MQRSARTMIVAAVAAIAVLSLAAVAGAGTSSGASPGGGAAGACLEGTTDCVDTPMPTGPDGSTGSAAGGTCPVGTPDCVDTPMPQVVEPTPGMADVYARIFDTATVGADDRTVTIDFTSGVEPCYVLDHVDVAATDDAVTITLFEGHDPAAGDVACIEIGVFKQVVITLDEPLDGRPILDGAAA
jgi:hypothetical protein